MTETTTTTTPTKTTGWKTRTAAVLTAIYAAIGLGIHYIAGHNAAGALDPATAIPLILGAFGLFGMRDAISKLIATLKK